jgi:hypothetical protein
MTQKQFDMYGQLASIRMNDAQRRETMAYMKRSEAVTDFFVRAAQLLRGAAAGMGPIVSKNRPSPSVRKGAS